MPKWGQAHVNIKTATTLSPWGIQLSISLAKALWNHTEFGRLKHNPHVTWSCVLWLSLKVPSLWALSGSRTCHWSTQACCTWCCGTSSLLRLQASLLSKKEKKNPSLSSYTHWSNFRLCCQVLLCLVRPLVYISLTASSLISGPILCQSTQELNQLIKVLHARHLLSP